jgi:glycerate kinase
MRVLLAFDKFKDAFGAPAVCAAAAQALGPRHQTDFCPLTDGGEGFVEILTQAAGGELRALTVTGPRGAPVQATFGLVPVAKIPPAARILLGIENPKSKTENFIAVLELAQTSGLALLPPEQRDPWFTTTRGVGELIRAAADLGVAAIVLGVGGSATHDVAAGALAALGLEFQREDGTPIADPGPHSWPMLAKVGGAVRAGLPPVFIACDVTNPLMGTYGAASVFAPQKGLLEEDFTRLEYMTGRVAALLGVHAKKHPLLCDTPGAGAAGGTAFGLMCALDAKLVPGFDLVAAWLDLDARIARADVVLTGEGRFDDTSLGGKCPGAVAQRALAAGKAVHVFAGQVKVSTPPASLHLHAITPTGTEFTTALHATAQNLMTVVKKTFV